MSAEFPVALRGAAAPTLMWAHEYDVEQSALAQLREVAALPWVEGVRVMPDVHLGKGATVGSVIAMRDAVCPGAVGVDIGCGMIAVRTTLVADDLPDDLHALRTRIEAAIPVGYRAHSEPIDQRRLRPVDDSRDGRIAMRRAESAKRFWDRFDLLDDSVQSLRIRAERQLGTLGGGNHFIELCTDGEGAVWLQLHSGSRNIGKELATEHMRVARRLDHNRAVSADLAVFLAETPEMRAYLRDLEWAQEYAARSRETMMALVCEAVREEFAGREVAFAETVNVHHNYVARERIDGADLVVTRKGAIRAGRGDLGLIPGSMGTGSYVVRGLGNPLSYWSASHGAGRRMSRNAARREFSVEDLERQTDGVECRKDPGVLDEIPAAYKDLDDVIAAQSDLVEVVARLTTLLCVKG